jgi:hypothetical protein
MICLITGVRVLVVPPVDVPVDVPAVAPVVPTPPVPVDVPAVVPGDPPSPVTGVSVPSVPLVEPGIGSDLDDDELFFGGMLQ